MSRRKKPKNDFSYFGYYVVAFLDIMGQRELLRNMYMPNSTGHDLHKTVLLQLKSTAGKVIGIRDLIENYMIGYGLETDIKRNAPKSIKAKMSAISKPKIRFMKFSDTLILFIPLGGTTTVDNIINIYALLSAVSITTMCSFAGNTPIRGSIKIGLGIDIEANEIYGPVLEKTYYMESRLSDYPRITVGDNFTKYLQLDNNTHHEQHINAIINFFSDWSLSMIEKDFDGNLILNYLSEKNYQISKTANIDCNDLYQKGLLFATEQYNIFSNNKNNKLSTRYNKLVDYYTKQKHIWQTI